MNPPTTTAAAAPEAARSRRARLRAWRSLSVTLPNDQSELLHVIRRLVHVHAIGCGAESSTAEDIELCASELVTNAMRYTDGPVRLELTVHAGTVQLQVSDTSTHAPGRPDAESAANGERGRGLHIVRKLALEVEVHLRQWGKTVTARFRV